MESTNITWQQQITELETRYKQAIKEGKTFEEVKKIFQEFRLVQSIHKEGPPTMDTSSLKSSNS